MIPVVGVRFRKAGKIYYFDPGEWTLETGTRVIVETAQGVECGEVAIGNKMVPKDDVVQPLRRIMRIASPEDLQKIGSDREREKEAFAYACERVEKRGLDMKIVDVEWTFDRQKLIFYFTADMRVDFRELVKDLAAHFRTRIELRQIGVRDESKMLGGYGVCGRSLCCATWIGDFEPISIRHAKEQELSLNPSKISGVCGRLKCCLRFEADLYQDIRKRMPKVGTLVKTPYGDGQVIELHLIKETVTVLVDQGDELRRYELGIPKIWWDGKPEEAGSAAEALESVEALESKEAGDSVAAQETAAAVQIEDEPVSEVSEGKPSKRRSKRPRRRRLRRSRGRRKQRSAAKKDTKT